MSSPGELPLIMTEEGPQPTPPINLLSALLAGVAASNPGYTANLPGSLIEDVSSTQVGGLTVADTARIESVNDVSPNGANAYILAMLGQMLGIPIGEQTNTSVYCVFSGPAGYSIAKGFVVSDGTYLYTCSDGGIIRQAGQSAPLFFVATQQGSWAVPANTVTTIETSVPPAIAAQLSVTNPQNGTPGVATGETESQYRARVFQANLAASQGMARYLKTLLGQVQGVQSRLISVQQVIGSGWKILCGGGDPYQVAGAIFQSLFNINTLVGSTISITGITNANPGVATTDLNHGLTTGQNNVFIAGATGMSGVNGGPYTVTVINEKEFSFGINTTSSGAYTGGGVVTPNPRNITVNVNDPPDTYAIKFINPPPQTVTINVTWNTISDNFVSEAAVAQLGAPALAAYINTIAVGQPINLFELQTVFQQSLTSILDPTLLTRMVFVVNINGVSTSPIAGTGIIDGDPESYFITSETDITIVQG